MKKFTVEVNRSFHNKKSMSKRMSSNRNNVALNKEVLIQRWQHQLINRTHLNFQEFLHLLRQHVWIKFRISFRSLLFRFNIDETWSLVLFDFLFFSFFRSQLLLETFFCLFDRDSSGFLSESEWIGSIYKVTEYVHMICSFIFS